MECSDNGAVVSLREEADEFPYCRCDGQPETASISSSFRSSPRRGRRRCLSLHRWPPNPPETVLFMEIFANYFLMYYTQVTTDLRLQKAPPCYKFIVARDHVLRHMLCRSGIIRSTLLCVWKQKIIIFIWIWLFIYKVKTQDNRANARSLVHAQSTCSASSCLFLLNESTLNLSPAS
jgi:hypothetical protein